MHNEDFVVLPKHHVLPWTGKMTGNLIAFDFRLAMREPFLRWGISCLPDFLSRLQLLIQVTETKISCQLNKCGKNHTVYSSCGNRHCPNCQQYKTYLWLEKQIERQLPGHHFMITFTVPLELRLFIRSHQRICYSALFKASSDT